MRITDPYVRIDLGLEHYPPDIDYTLHVEAPKGWTQQFAPSDVAVMVRMGLIKETKRTGNSEWETIFFGPAATR